MSGITSSTALYISGSTGDQSCIYVILSVHSAYMHQLHSLLYSFYFQYLFQLHFNTNAYLYIYVEEILLDRIGSNNQPITSYHPMQPAISMAHADGSHST